MKQILTNKIFLHIFLLIWQIGRLKEGKLRIELRDEDDNLVESVDRHDNAKNHAYADTDDADDVVDDDDDDASDCTLTLPAVALSSNPLPAGHPWLSLAV